MVHHPQAASESNYTSIFAMTPKGQDLTAVSDSDKTNVTAAETMKATIGRAFTASGEIKQPKHVTRNRGTFKSALWASEPRENANHVGGKSLGISDPHEAPVSLTVSSDPRVNDRRNFSPRNLLLSLQEDQPATAGHRLEAESTTHPGGAPRVGYTLGQQAVLQDTTGMLRRFPDSPSPEEFKAMNSGEQGRIVRKFLGVKSAGIFTRSMNSASQAHVSTNSMRNSSPVESASPAVSALPPRNPITIPAPPTRMRDVWQQRVIRRTNLVTGATTAAPAGQANDLSPEGKFRVFFEGRTWDTEVSNRLLFTKETFINSTEIEENGTSSALENLEVTEDDFYQLVNDNYGSALAAHHSAVDNSSLGLLQYVSAEERLTEGINEPVWPENPGDISLSRENSDLKVLVQQLEQAAGREEYTNIMNHIVAPEDPRDMPTYRARHAVYHEDLVHRPGDPPMFPVPEGNQEPPVIPSSVAHIFQEVMQLIENNEVLIESFEQEFKAFVAAYSPASHDISLRQHFAVANKLVTHMVRLKKENEEMGKLIGCGIRGDTLAAVNDAEMREMHQEILGLREQVDRARKDKKADDMKNVPEESLEINVENQKLREELHRLKMRNTQLEGQKVLQDEELANLRGEIDSLRLKTDDLQEQLGDMWENIAESGL